MVVPRGVRPPEAFGGDGAFGLREFDFAVRPDVRVGGDLGGLVGVGNVERRRLGGSRREGRPAAFLLLHGRDLHHF